MEYSLLGQREDLKSYYFIRVNALTGSWEKLPPSIKPRAQWRSSFMLQNAILPICWLGTRERQGLSSAIMVRLFPSDSAAAHERLHAIFSDVRKEHLKWFADPDNVMPDQLRWMLNVLQGDSLAFHSLGYWYVRPMRSSCESSFPRLACRRWNCCCWAVLVLLVSDPATLRSASSKPMTNRESSWVFAPSLPDPIGLEV